MSDAQKLKDTVAELSKTKKALADKVKTAQQVVQTHRQESKAESNR